MNDLIRTPLFGLLLSLIAYELGMLIYKKTKSQLFNPLFNGILLTILTLSLFNIPLEDYAKGGSIISFFLGPATIILAVPLYKQRQVLKKNFFPIISGITLGSLFSVAIVFALMRLFNLEEVLVISMLPKSVTTPIGLEISKGMGGIPEVSIAAIVLTGIIGAIVAPITLKCFRITNPVAKGIAIGTSAHAVGTTKALEMGDIEGAMSSLSIGIAGLATVFLAPLLYSLLL